MKTYFPSDMELGTAFTFQDVASISKTTAHRTICVKPADDVEIEYDGKVEYCTIEEIVLAQCGDRKYLGVVPHWYTATITRTKTPKLHNIRQTPLLTRAHLRDRVPWFLALVFCSRYWSSIAANERPRPRI